MGILRIQGAL